MLINLRNAMMAGKRLPYDAEVEYLESTGTQWIDTGVSISNASLADVTWNVEAVSYNDGCMGAYGIRPYASMYFNLYKNKFYMRNMRTEGGSFTGVSGFNTVRFSGGNSYLNGTAVETEIPLNINPVRTMYLFAYNRSETMPGFCKARVSSFIVKENGVLLCDFIPVRKGTVGYLYDRVSGKLFGNAGTGDFVLGPDVVPVEYIESHGTEWIDTGLVWDSLKWECVADITATRKIDENYIISQYGSGQGAVYAFVYMHQNEARLAYNRNAAAKYVVNNQFFGTKHTWHAIYESGAQRLDIGDNIHLSASQQYVAGLTEEGMRIILGGMQTFGGKATGIRFGNVMIAHVSTSVRSFRPVRVGTGSTWEGAMMDTLTRRIYRNAGTGAFTYGNDLKYPIPAE